MTNTATLPCVVCGTQLADAFPDQDINQPSGGTTFTSNGNYGSTVFDPMDSTQRIEVNVCDDCLVRAGDAGQVRFSRLRTVTTEEDVRPWSRTTG